MGIFRSNNPAEYDDIDGIIIDESAPPPSVQGVAANIVCLVAKFQRGPADLSEPGSIGAIHEQYGKSSFSGNIALKNKKFGRLKVIRVIAADAVLASKAFQSSATDRITFSAKQGKGAYGNNIQVKIEEASSSRQHSGTITTVADVAGSLDQKYFVLADEVGTVGFWIDVDNGGGSAPAGALAAARQVEITTVATGDSAATVATKVAAAISADSKFTASAVGTLISWNVDAYAPEVGSESAGDSGFTVTELVAGVYAGKKYTIKDTNTDAVLPQEVYDGVKIAEITADTFAASALVTAVVNSSAAEPSNVAFTSLEDGDDGTVGNTDYESAIALAAVENSCNVLILDEYNATRNGYLKQHAADTQDKMVIICGPEAQTVSEVVTDVASYRDVDGRIIYAYPYVETVISGVKTFTPPASWYASILSQTSPHIDPAYVANSQFLAGMSALKLYPSRAQYIQLKEAGVSAFELDSDIGFKIKSGIVTQISNSSKVTVLRRRMADYLTVSVAKFLKNYQNAPNTAANRREVKGSILSFDESQIRDGILPSDAEVKDGLARLIDTDSLNTDDSIAAGLFKVKYKRRIFSSMRFIVLVAEIGESVVVTEGAE